jgi:acetyl-CoA C-acetyltransferase
MSDMFKQAAIVGVYQTAQTRAFDRRPSDMFIEVVKGVLDDAGMSVKEVDGLIGPNPLATEGEARGFPSTAFSEYFGTHIRYTQQTPAGTQTGAMGVLHAVEAVASGLAQAVIVPNVGGREGPAVVGRDEWESTFGLPRVAYYGMMARRHMHEYGTTSAQLAQVAVIARKHAALNPNAVMHSRGPITVEDVLDSRMIYDPLHLLDCCIVNEGAGAVLVTTAERARSLKHKPVKVLGLAESFAIMDLYNLPSLTTSDGRGTGQEAFAMAGVSHADIDVAQISDHFTINPIIELEDLGFCGKGEGGSYVESGVLELGGKMPMNTNGGYLSHSHSGGPGIYDIIELVHQLRGEAGARQVRDAHIGLYHGVGGMFNSAHTAILARE